VLFDQTHGAMRGGEKRLDKWKWNAFCLRVEGEDDDVGVPFSVTSFQRSRSQTLPVKWSENGDNTNIYLASKLL
jgi:hypothetical protein